MRFLNVLQTHIMLLHILQVDTLDMLSKSLSILLNYVKLLCFLDFF